MPTKARNHNAKRKADGGRLLVDNPHGGRMLRTRKRLGVNRDVFARLIPVSVRTLASIESGEAAPSESVSRALKQLERVIASLSGVIAADALGEWIQKPNSAFHGLKPLEVIERGEIDKIWRMIYFLESGTPG